MTAAWRPIILLLSANLAFAAEPPPLRYAPAIAGAAPANQLAVAGNACGPAALLNAMRFGSDPWRAVAAEIDGENDRQQLLTIIRRHGMRPSPHLGGRPRWSRRGVNVADLHDIANELIDGRRLPALRNDILITRDGESPGRLLARSHGHIETSLARGFPPVMSLRRFALRETAGEGMEWTVIDAHFVTIIAVERRLPRRADHFVVEYIDPWGGERRSGRIAIPERPLLVPAGSTSPCLEAVFPDANVGRDRVRKGETTAITASALIGRW